jgi:hypothetical protein
MGLLPCAQDCTARFEIRPKLARLPTIDPHPIGWLCNDYQTHFLPRPLDAVSALGDLGTRAVCPGLHALKLRVKDPDGDNAPWFSQAVMAGDGTAEINLPIAWNERPGTWTVTVEDLYTGKSAVHVFTVGD